MFVTHLDNISNTNFHEPEDDSFVIEIGSWHLPSGGICVVDFAPIGADPREGYFPDRIKAHFIGTSSPSDLIHYYQVICHEIAKVLSKSVLES